MEPKSLLAGLSLGIAVLVVFIIAANIALSNTGRQLASCNAEKNKLQQQLDNLTKLLHALNKKLSEKTAELQRLSAELQSCREKSGRLETSLQAYQREVERLQAELGRARQLYTVAVENATRCRQRVDALLTELREARQELAEMNETLIRLRLQAANCTTIKENYTRLLEEYQALKNSYSQLLNRGRVLEYELEKLKQDLEAKQEECSRLRETLANTTARLDAATRELERLRQAVLAAAAWYDAVNQSLEARFYDKVLRIAANQCFDEASRLGIQGYTTEYRVRRVFAYIETSYTVYIVPPAARYIDPYSYGVRVAYGSLQLPNETMAARAGDPWSLALLAYGLLQSSATGTNQHYYLIRLYTTKGVFSAALVVEQSYTGAKYYYLVDPGDDYCNDAAIAFDTFIGATPAGTLRRLWPWQLSGPLKRSLVDSFQANLTYIDTVTWTYSRGPRVIDNPDTLLSHWYLWIRSLYGDAAVIKIDIHGIGTHVALYSLTQAAQWLRLKG